jgi:hypothetical protein
MIRIKKINTVTKVFAALVVLSINALSCSKPQETPYQQKSPLKNEPLPQAADISLLDLPSWCSVKESSDEVCFSCERQDGNIKIPYEQCLIPAENFSASTNCSFSDGLTKQISCSGTKSGEPFRMDSSLAKEKLAAVLPAFLVGLDLVVRQTFSDQSDVAKLTADLSAFWSSRIPSIVRGENFDGVASDLVSLVKRHVKTPLTDEQADHFKTISVTALTQLNQELMGRKDYTLSQVILRGIALSKSIPEKTLGEASRHLSGQGIADLLASENAKTFLAMFKAMNPSILGMSSVEDFLVELTATPN